jgi:hypothetical protein
LEEEVIEDAWKGLTDPDGIFRVLVRVWRVNEDGSDVLESCPVDRHIVLRKYQGWFLCGQRMGSFDEVENSDGSLIRRKAPGSDGSFLMETRFKALDNLRRSLYLLDYLE